MIICILFSELSGMVTAYVIHYYLLLNKVTESVHSNLS